jgi:hypothetical protein
MLTDARKPSHVAETQHPDRRGTPAMRDGIL